MSAFKLPSPWMGEGPGMGVTAPPSANVRAAPQSLPFPPRGGKGFLVLICLALLALLSTPSLCAPSLKSTPLATVQAVYAVLPRPTPPELLSRPLRALIRKDDARRERNLDFEWRSGGQDSPQITIFRLHLVRIKGDAATVEATFFNRGERRFRRFFLVREAGRWVVDDALLVPENGKLQDFLKGKG